MSGALSVFLTLLGALTPTFWIAAGLCLFVAMFRVWWKEYQRSEELLQRETQWRESQKAVDELARLRVEGVQLSTRKIISEDGLLQWQGEHRTWIRLVVDLLDLRFTAAVRMRFVHLGSLRDRGFSHFFNSTHNSELLALDRRLQVLDETIGAGIAFVRRETGPDGVDRDSVT
jgi:hypothetical protein